jgi:hypothetical protein
MDHISSKNNYIYKYYKYKKKFQLLKEQLGGSNNITIHIQSRKYHNNIKSFNVISNYMKTNNKKYLNWELLNIIEDSSPSEYDKKNINNDEYKLFPTEEFLNSKWSFLNELIQQYDNYFNSSRWFNDKPTQDIFDSNIMYPVILQKIVITDTTAKFCIIGDIHTSLHSLISIIENIKDDYFESDGTDMILKHNRYIIFLGDIVDRGPYNMEVLFIVLSLKNKNFNNVIILDGNHEDYMLLRNYDTEEEFNLQFQDKSTKISFVDSKINRILNRLTTCVYLFVHGKVYHLSHGAFDSIYAGFLNGKDVPDNKDFHKETTLYKFLESNTDFCLLDNNNSYTNYKWGDFNNNIEQTRVSPRGSDIFEYSYNLTKEYLERFKINNIISGHQDQEPINFLINKSNNTHNFIKSKIYNLYQPNSLRTFKVNNNDFLAITTSTATVSRDLDVEGIYIEITI